jgi:hypothetical protein
MNRIEEYSMKSIVKFLPTLLMSTASFAAVTGYQVNPATVQSGTSKAIQLLENHDDGPSVDVTSLYNFSAGSNQIKISTFSNRPIVTGSIAGNQSITATKKSDSSTQSVSVQVTSGVASKIGSITGAAQLGMVGTSLSQPIALKVLDMAGNPVPNIKVNFSVTSGAATFGGGQTTDSINTDINGQVSETVSLGLTWGRIQIKAQTDISLPNGSNSYTFQETSAPATGAPASLAIVDSPASSQVTTQPFSRAVNVQILDSNGLPVSTQKAISIAAYMNSSCTSPALGTLSGTTSSTSSSLGMASFSGLSYSTTDMIYIKASSDGVTSTCSRAISIIDPVGTAAKLAITGAPSTAIQNRVMFPQFSVEVRDANNKLVTSSSDSISLDLFTDSLCTIHGGGSSTGGSASAIQGKAYFPSFQTDQSGTFYIRASSGTMQTACSSGIVVSPDPILTVTSVQFYDSISSLQYTNIILQLPIQLQVSNVFNQIVTAGTYPVTLAAYTDSSCSVATQNLKMASPTATNSLNGIARFNNVYFAQTGTYYLKATSGSLSSGCSSPITVADPGTSQVASISWSANPPSQITAGVAISPSLSVIPKDLNGNTVTNTNLSLQAMAYSDDKCFNPATEFNKKFGFATNGLWTLDNYTFSKVETIYIGVKGSRMVPLCYGPIAISPAAASKIAIISGNNQDTQINKQLRNPLIAQVTDQFNNPIPNYSVQFSVTNGGFASPQPTIQTDSTGQVQAVITLGGTIGPQTITAGNPALASIKSVNFSATALSSDLSGGVIQVGTSIQVQGTVAVFNVSPLTGAIKQASSDGTTAIEVGDINSISVQGQP